LLGVKYAYEMALTQHVPWPAPEQVAAAFTYAAFPSPSGVISMSIGGGHQAIEPAAYGLAGEYNTPLGEVAMTQVRQYPAACVNPPDGVTTEAWIRSGFPGAECP
jgi:branched-chain amino acid transport system substrate-binding protein